MEFKARVTLAATPAEQKQESETARAKALLIEAMKILTKNDATIQNLSTTDSSIVDEAEAFLEGAGA